MRTERSVGVRTMIGPWESLASRTVAAVCLLVWWGLLAGDVLAEMWLGHWIAGELGLGIAAFFGVLKACSWGHSGWVAYQSVCQDIMARTTE